MRRVYLSFPAAALLFASSMAMAQAKPNFSGKWTILPDSGVQQQGGSRGGGEMGGLGEAATIVQNEKTLTITRPTPNMGEFTSTFNLDGTETYSSVTIGGNPIPLTYKMRWDGSKFISSTWANVGQQIEIILVIWLDDKGNLVTEHTTPAMGGGNTGGTFTTKYKKGS